MLIIGLIFCVAHKKSVEINYKAFINVMLFPLTSIKSYTVAVQPDLIEIA